VTSLRRSVYQGGGYLAARQVAGMVISAGGILLLTRLLGPAQYGLYAAALAFQMMAQIVAGWGVGTYLVRRPADDGDRPYHHAFSFLLVAGLAAVAAAVLALPLLERLSRLDLGAPALVLFLAVPVQLMAVVPLARIERALDFRSVARIEIGGQLVFFLTALPLAAAGFGVWAPVLGFWVQQSLLAAGYFGAARYRPRWQWSGEANRAMVRFGSGYSFSICVWQARRLANPLIVGRYLGSEAVAYVALAIQITAQLGFVVGMAWRLSVAALARIQTDAARTARAISEGMHLQALAVGPPLVIFGWVGGWLVPQLFGAAWAPVMLVYPAIAIGFLSNSVFLMQSSALYVRERNWEVTAFHLANIMLLAGTAVVLVPRIGLMGYAWGEIAALLSYGVLHLYVSRHVTRFWQPAPALAWLGFAVAIALPGQRLAGAIIIVSLVLARPARQLAIGMWREMRGHAYDA
jgi:O-antigen/teichoic acid export membrane protein